MARAAGNIMTTQISTSTSSSSKKASRKLKRRQARSSSVFTTTSSESTRVQDEELATAKAAAIKLLDQSSEEIILEEFISPPLAKRIRIEHVPTIVEEETILPELINYSTTAAAAQTELNPSPQALVSSNASAAQKQILPGVSKSVAPISSQSTSTSDKPAQKQDSFQVSREEIFAETALVDAFRAAIDEFKFCCYEKSQAIPPTRLPRSHSEKRRTAALYYGKPPAPTTTKNKKPPLQTIFLPFLIVAPAESLSTTEAKDTQPVRHASPVISDLDMDEYWDMVEGILKRSFVEEIQTLVNLVSSTIQALPPSWTPTKRASANDLQGWFDRGDVLKTANLRSTVPVFQAKLGFQVAESDSTGLSDYSRKPSSKAADDIFIQDLGALSISTSTRLYLIGPVLSCIFTNKNLLPSSLSYGPKELRAKLLSGFTNCSECWADSGYQVNQLETSNEVFNQMLKVYPEEEIMVTRLPQQ
ncbi:hypothetical protein PSTT_12815 [Puccinia striiformis]|uniref:Uncharacterized protein n=2 Tax=Puccinia striiformis TaxID=27350 RepID=A0A2S4UUE0_9BASI|nr:hypothetical protein PSTT_12815 [Puccinia striiformis]